jgi:hypothetical protein
VGPVFGPNEAFSNCHNVHAVFLGMVHYLQEMVEVSGKAGHVSDQDAIKGPRPLLSDLHQTPELLASSEGSAGNGQIDADKFLYDVPLFCSAYSVQVRICFAIEFEADVGSVAQRA